MPQLSNSGHEAFCRVFVATRHFAKAAAAAGSEAENLSQAGAQIYDRPDVQARLRELNNKVLKVADISAARIMLELGRLSTIDARKFHHADGSQKEVHELDDDAAACVKGFDRAGRFQFYDKNPALATLAKHFKIVGDEGDGVSALASALADRLNSAKRRMGEPARPVVDSTPVPSGADESEGEQLW